MAKLPIVKLIWLPVLADAAFTTQLQAKIINSVVTLRFGENE
jgi:hypothetical protein